MSIKHYDEYVIIGRNIRKYRLLKGLSQEKLSELLCANSKFIGHVERVERFISLKKIFELCEILEIDAEDLFKKSALKDV